MPEKKRKRSEGEQHERISPKKAPKSTTLKQKILAIVAEADTLLGLPSIKRELIAQYGHEDSKIFRANVNKAIKSLLDERHEGFGKVGGSYHAGQESIAFRNNAAQKLKQSELDEHARRGESLCPYCNSWGEHTFLREDSVARGGRHQCLNCPKKFWTWISDMYLFGHKVEYRYGDGLEDYRRT